MKAVEMVAGWLLILAGLNYGLMGLVGTDLFSQVLGVGSVARVVDILVGLSAVWMAYSMAMSKK